MVRTDDAPPDTVERLWYLMTEGERARCLRLVRDVDRRTFAITRALVRRSLSGYGPTAPADWHFVTNQHQCPFVDPVQAGTPPLQFNLSHTHGLVALAVTRGHRVGVDVERVTRVVDLAVADRHFAPAEVRDLRRLPAEEQPVAFFEYWTLKEAYIKARGMSWPCRSAPSRSPCSRRWHRPLPSCPASTTCRAAGSSGRPGPRRATACRSPSNARATTWRSP